MKPLVLVQQFCILINNIHCLRLEGRDLLVNTGSGRGRLKENMLILHTSSRMNSKFVLGPTPKWTCEHNSSFMVVVVVRIHWQARVLNPGMAVPCQKKWLSLMSTTSTALVCLIGEPDCYQTASVVAYVHWAISTEYDENQPLYTNPAVSILGVHIEFTCLTWTFKWIRN